MQSKFRESAVKVLRFPRTYKCIYINDFDSVKVHAYVYQWPRLEETRDRDREPFQSGAGNGKSFILSIERKSASLTIDGQNVLSRFTYISCLVNL